MGVIIRPRQPALLSPAAYPAHAALVDAVFAAGGRTLADRLRRAHAAELARIAPDTRLRDVTPEAWAALTRARLAAGRRSN